MDRRLAAVLAADVVGYSRHMEADETRTLQLVRKIQTDIVSPQVIARGGQIVKSMGDGWLAEFSTAADAVNSALSIQALMQDSELSMRIGVNVGDITHIDEDIFGSGVNVAARLEGVAPSGGIAISDDVRRLMRDAIEANFHPNGPIELKNIQAPVVVWSWPTPLKNTRKGVAGADTKPKIWLGKFDAHGAAASEMASALHEDLSHAFGRQTGLSLEASKDEADFALLASVRSSQERWRVNFHLSEVSSGRRVWTDRLDEHGEDIFEMQDRLCQRIAGSVRIRIPALLSEKLRNTPLGEMTVEQLLTHAMGYNFVPAEESWMRSRQALELALERDPENWMAMTMLSWNVMGMNRILGWQNMSQADMDIAKLMIDRATSLMPNDHVVRAVRGFFSLYGSGDLQMARVDMEEAVNLNRNFYHAINGMSLVEIADGETDKAVRLAEITLTCEPAYPYRHLYCRDAGLVALVSGECDQAVRLLMLADRAAPDLVANIALLAAANVLAGQDDVAKRHYARLLELASDFEPREFAQLPFREKSVATMIPDALSSLRMQTGE